MSGAKNCPETPRQKMIGMMYLFLTAMLALNVSTEVLNGFVMVNNSLLQTVVSSKNRNADLMERFQTAYGLNKKKVGPWLDSAKVVQQKSNELYDYINAFKLEITKLADGKNGKLDSIRNMDNLDVGGQYAIVAGHGKELQQKIADYKNFMIRMNPGQSDVFTRNFATTGGADGKDWSEKLFEMMPVVAANTMLTKYQVDIKAAETSVIQYLMEQTDAQDVKVNKIQAYVIPVSTYVTVGDKFTAQAFLGAVDSTSRPTYIVNGSTLSPNSNGRFEFVCNQPGIFPYNVNIQIGQGQDTKSYSFKGSYTVGAKSATVTNTALNVVYAGIDNEMSASVPGVPSANIQLSCSGDVQLSQKPNGLWNCHPNATSGKITFSISAKMAGSNNFQPMGDIVYIIRQLPDPTPYLVYKDNGVEKKAFEGNVSLSALNDGVIVADYKNEIISANFTVTGFSIEYPNGEQLDSRGSTLTSAQKARLAQERVGSRILIKSIKAVGPDKLTRSLPLVAVKLSGR